MPKKKSNLNKYTWIFTELLIGLAALIYGLWGTIAQDQIIYIILLSMGGVLLVVAIIQLIIALRKREKLYCAKCGDKIKKDDEFCKKCGEKIEKK